MALAVAYILLSMAATINTQQPNDDSNPNLMAAMTGYNILKGNPFSMNALHDPGFLASYIFNPYTSSGGPPGMGDGSRQLHPGVTVRNIRQCDLSLTTDTITTMKEYQRQVTTETSAGMEFASNVEADVQASVNGIGIDTTVPPLVKSSFSASNSFRESEKFFSQNKGVVTLNDATCTSYTAVISAYNPPPFSDNFLKALIVLHRTSFKSEAEKDREFYRFIDNFGTHFLSHATMGTRLAITRKYTSDEYSNSKDEAIKDCNVQQLSVFFGQQVDSKLDHCKAVDKSSSSKIENIYEREFISSYGSKPAKDLVDWSTQDFPNPLPVRMTLRPILNLFGTTYMKHPSVKRLRIQPKNILKWIAPRYYNFCNKYKNILGVKTCNAEAVKGCGWSDTCNRRSQHCINDKTDPNGYRCCDIKQCADQPCKYGACHVSGKCSYVCKCRWGYTGKHCEHEILTASSLEMGTDILIAANRYLSHDQMAKNIQLSLVKHYGIKFTVLVYDDVYGYGLHNVQGTQFYSNFREWGHNVVVGYSQNDLESTPEQMAMIKWRLLGAVLNQGCHSSTIVEKVKDLLHKYNIPYSMIFSTPWGNKLRTYSDVESTYFLNYDCGVGKKASIAVMLR
eukprot:TCONS_00070968-protein